MKPSVLIAFCPISEHFLIFVHKSKKFPETCQRAFGADILDNPPPAFVAMEKAPITQKLVVDVDGIDDSVRALFK